ncbi:hypothetical protein ALGA_2796 [Labilibaculum antarcticum]|uniref:Uncharacterized protein n=2 Tax=Labilibaculum antarcticum TaxID=1717717 RepID=A0A1Y1CL25_9BACT|nr:hypothetical protein ALGA_2796 [Labilibaculum antarcticum]
MLFVVACDEDDYTAPDTLSDVSWYTGIHPGELYAVNIGEYVSFMDISQGMLSHKWSIDEGNNYLSPEFSVGDDLTNFIIADAPLTTDETTIHVLFNNTGLNKVRLYNTFSDSVTYPGTIPYGSVRKGDVWVIDTSLVVDVYQTINPEVKIFQDEVLVGSVTFDQDPLEEEQATWDTIYVEAGSSLKYIDVSTVGRSTKRTWNLKGANFLESKNTDSIAVVHYFGMGSYIGSITAERSVGFPDGKVVKNLPYIVKVIQSSQPFIVADGSFTEDVNEVISFNVSGEVKDFSGEEANFTVHVENATSGFSQDIAVTSAKVNEDNRTKIELELAEVIYNTDVVTITYAGGNIKSVDDRKLEAFTTPQKVKMNFPNSQLDPNWAGFEISNDNWKKAFCEGYFAGNKNGTASAPIFSRVEGSLSPSEKPCMNYTSAGGVTDLVLMGSNFKAMLPDEGSYTYQISFEIYIETGSNLTQLTTIVLDPFTPITWDVTGVEEGKWVTLNQVVSFPSLPTKRYDLKMISADNPGAGDVKLYLDNHSFVLLEERP